MGAHETPHEELELSPIDDALEHGAVDPTRDYVLELATVRDVLELHRLFFATPRRGARRLLRGEVRRLVDDETLWLARERASGHIVGTCFIEIPRAENGEVEGPAEYGGAIVLSGHRGRGLGLVLTSVAIAHHFWDDDPAPLLAHAFDGDHRPRATMHRAGFRVVGRMRLPRDTRGLEHLAAADGSIHADALALEDHGRAWSFRRVASYLERGSVMGGDGRPSAIYLEVHPEMSAEALRRAAGSIDAVGGDDSAAA
ncbi:MAG: GNAT family N-acetyltransferase [Myxococcales bacterium]|nr:GNAT family N-acetyltransferase [Myxococcales bacterium]MCB9715958.1 GNAT family N-acetyltransferase [Myxococcales bacterium]